MNFSKVKKRYIDWKYSIISNPLENIIKRFLSKKKKEKNSDEKIDMLTLIENPNLSFTFIKRNIKKLGKRVWWNRVCDFNPNVPIKYVKKTFKKRNDRYRILPRNINITKDDIEKYPDFDWNNPSISKNINITICEILKYNLSFWYFSKNPNVTIDIVLKYNDKSWDWNSLSKHPNITMQDIVKNIDKPWQWPFVSENPNLTIGMVLAFKDKNWNWKEVSRNCGITENDIQNNPTLPWVWEYISLNVNIGKEFIMKNLEKPFSEKCLLINPSFVLDKTQMTQAKFSYYLSNPSLTYKITEKYRLNFWQWSLIGKNQFYYNENFFRKSLKSDIQKRREAFNFLYQTDISHLTSFYISYN